MLKGFLQRIAPILLALMAVVIIGTFSFSRLEGLSLFNAFYFTIITVATVGFGDITPVTAGGKALTIFVVVVGVGAFTGLVVNSTQFLIERRTERQRSNRLNMLVELFFSEVGSDLLRVFSNADPGFDSLHSDFKFDAGSADASLAKFRKTLTGHPFSISPERLQLEPLKTLLEGKADLLVRLLENPNLIENESITELLRATFHLRQELKSRVDFSILPHSDLQHLAFDAKRAYVSAAAQWMNHADYLKVNYPYLFSISMRMNPFSESTFPIVK
jgi:voltage-gated potassium channel